MREIVGEIHTSNKNLYPNANKKNQFDDKIEFPPATTPQGKNSGNAINFINYENDNIIETDDS